MPSSHTIRSFWLSSAFLVACSLAHTQTTIATGSVQGTVTDSSGAVIPFCTVTITDNATGGAVRATTNQSGTYSSSALLPGKYLLRIEAKGFATLELSVVVEVGVTASGNAQLEIGSEKRVIEVYAPEIRVNTEQAAIQGIINADQIEQLPLNGRKFLDLAQLEPGIQIQDGTSFDPTKVGSIGISFGGRVGRSARIQVDGIDTTDEVVGTTTTEIPSSAIEEFQVSQSSLDLSNELTTEGAVNVVTMSGTNQFHGELFGLFRDSSVAAAMPGPKANFQREQFGGKLGGPIVKTKLFFLADMERTKQDLFASIPLSAPFSAFSGGSNSPFRETDVLGRLDWQLKGTHVFYRFAYYQDLFGTGGYQPFNNKNYTPSHVVGADFSAGGAMHSIRFGYLFYRNNIADAVRGSSLPFANYPVSLIVGPLATGPIYLAPQATRQSNHQVRYDGSKVAGAHILRFGISYTLIRGGGYAKFQSIAPVVLADIGDVEQDFADNSCGGGAPCFPGGRTNPLNYPVEFALIGNGLGFLTERPAFGFPLGGISDNRLGIYAGDNWKVKPNFTLSYGLRYGRDTGRTNSDLPAIDAVNEVLPGLGDRVRQPNFNFAPQVGFAWDPWKNGKTSFRAAAGTSYENVIWAATLLDRSFRLPNGGFLDRPAACSGGIASTVLFADGSQHTPPAGVCADPSGNRVAIGLAASGLSQFQDFFQSVAASVGGASPNPSFLGNLVLNGVNLPGYTFAPDYRTPRSIQINAGIEREIRPGTVISADYLRNVSLHFLVTIDVNHTGDASLLNIPAALAAISATNALFGCGSGTDRSSIDCAIHNGAAISDYAARGLDSPNDLGIGACPSFLGVECAFGGSNPVVGPAPFQFPIGRSVYNALQLRFKQQVDKPFPGLQQLSLQVSYALSRFVNPGGKDGPLDSDQDFGFVALDNRAPARFTGPSTLDRTHQLSFGGVAALPASFRVSFIGHFYTALPATLTVPYTNIGAGEIFRTDFTGDGTVSDLLPGTRAGSFGRDIKVRDLNPAITNYNNTVALKPTPAGQALMGAHLFTETQLAALGAVAPKVLLAPPGEVGLGGLRSFDFSLNWAHKFYERVTIEPSVSIFNLFNFANFDLPGSTLSGFLTGGPGSVNGTTYSDRVSNRVGVGTGVFALGAPRVFEFGIRLSF